MEKKTNCEKCGKALTYKTKKPRWCKKCKPKTEIYRQPKRPPQQSKNERKMHKVMAGILPDLTYITGGYYSWLLSPKNEPMQLDLYFPTVRLAFEFNGRQHYEYNPYMHKTMEAFNYLQECDRLKAKTCKRLGVTLVTVKYDKDVTKGYMIRRLKEEGLLEGLKKLTTVDEDYVE